MSVKTYWSLWVLLILAAALLFATGNLTMMVVVVIGFFAFGFTFMGMMNVLPSVVSHATHPEPPKVKSVALQPMHETPAKAFSVLKSA